MEELNVLNDTQEQVVDVPNEQAEVAEVKTEVVENVNSEVVTEQQKEVAEKEVKPVQSKEDNAKFAEQRRKYEKELEIARQEARDALVSEEYGKFGVHTEAQYKERRALEKRNKEIAALTKNGKMDVATANELLEARTLKAREKEQKAEAEKAKQKAEKDKAEGLEFLDYFEKVNGKPFNGKTDRLPQEVIDAANKGEKLKYAYMDYRETQNKKAQEVASNNAKIAETETGSIVGNGGTEKPLTEAMIEKMTYKERKARWPEVKKVMGMI